MKNLLWLFPLLSAASVFGAGCGAGVGDWKWFNGGTVTIQQNQGLLYDGKPSGKWECSDAGRGLMTLRWNAGWVDTVTVAGDRLAGKNKQGASVSGTRKINKPPATHAKS